MKELPDVSRYSAPSSFPIWRRLFVACLYWLVLVLAITRNRAGRRTYH
jgi:hypothetical protein